MKKLVVMGLAMAMTAAMVNGVCAQPVQAADGEGLKVALLLSGAANDQGWNQTAYEGAQKAMTTDNPIIAAHAIMVLTTFFLRTSPP